MKFLRTLPALTAISAIFLVPSAWSVTYEQHDSQHPDATATVQVAQAKPGMPASGMGNMKGMETQMKMMSEMHDKMRAAKTPEERSALMDEHMKIMQNSMSMMGSMGTDTMKAKPGDMAARHGMMEQRMDMMQAMMQMMMDRTQTVPATK